MQEDLFTPYSEVVPQIDKLGYLARGLREAEQEQWKGILSQYASNEAFFAFRKGYQKARQDERRPRHLQHAKPVVYVEPSPSKRNARSGKHRAEKNGKLAKTFAWKPVGDPDWTHDKLPPRSERAKSALTR